MGVVNWLKRKSVEKSVSNIEEDVGRLCAAADASWSVTLNAMEAGTALPSPPPQVRSLQQSLLRSLQFRSLLSEHEALGLVHDGMSVAQAGDGAKMAVRFVVLKSWPKSRADVGLSEEEMEAYVGPWSEVEEMTRLVAEYETKRRLREA